MKLKVILFIIAVFTGLLSIYLGMAYVNALSIDELRALIDSLYNFLIAYYVIILVVCLAIYLCIPAISMHLTRSVVEFLKRLE